MKMVFGLFWEGREGSDRRERRNGSGMHVPKCRVPTALGPEWRSLPACPPFLSMPFVTSRGGEGWEEGVKFLFLANFLLKISSLFCLN